MSDDDLGLFSPDRDDDEGRARERGRYEHLADVADDAIDHGHDVLVAAVWVRDDGTLGKAPLHVRGHLEAHHDKQLIRQQLVNPPHVPKGVPAKYEVVIGMIPGTGERGVLDCDVKNGKRGKETLKALVDEHGDFISAAWRTPSGGLNVLWRKPPGASYSNTSPWREDGIDVRADGGWVVAPGNECAAGTWAWRVGGYDTTQPLPDAILALLTPVGAPHERRASNAETLAFIEASPRSSSYDAQRLFGIELEKLKCADEGSRHEAMKHVVSWAWGMVALDLRWALQQVNDLWADLTADEDRGDEVDSFACWVTAQEQRKRANERAEMVEPGSDETPGSIPALVIEHVSDVAARVDAAGDPGFLFRPIWPAGDYGALGAEKKAGKTWMALDALVSVASGTPWLGHYGVDQQGPVVAFLGEGGERKTIRRLRAVCAVRGLVMDDLSIRLCHRVPHLSSQQHLDIVKAELATATPVLVVVDPMYLAARGAKSSDLFEMGAQLEPMQVLCQDAATALLVSHHWNKTGVGTGSERFSGAGLAEWGRVLISVAVKSREVDPISLATTVELNLEVTGDEGAEGTLTLQRRVWSDHPEKLTSPLHYVTKVLATPGGGSGALVVAPPALMDALSRALDQAGPLPTRDVLDLVRGEKALRKAALRQLVDGGFVQATPGARNATIHTSITPYRAP